MPKESLPDVLYLWDFTWTRQGDVGVGPRVGGPDDAMLREARHCQHIEVQGEPSVMSHPWLTLDCFTWHAGDLALPWPEEAP